jgi:nitrogen regulatory protein P-II 1
MKCIEAIIKPSMLENVKQRVRQVGVKVMTLSEVTDCGGTVGQQRIYRTAYVVDSVSRVRLQTIVDENMVGPVVDAIMAGACAGDADNGTISVYPVAETIRIQPGARPYTASTASTRPVAQTKLVSGSAQAIHSINR